MKLFSYCIFRLNLVAKSFVTKIQGFCDFVIFFFNRRNFDTSILFSLFQELWKYYLSSVDVGIIGQTMLKSLVYFYDDLFIFVFLNS